MRQNMSGWSQAECDELKKAGIADEILYYHRALGKEEKYTAHVFIAQYASPEQLKQNWERLNDNIALLYQSNVDSLLERSNFYLCFFLPKSMNTIEKEKIENDAYCAKKYIFVSEKELSVEEKIQRVNEKIFELTYLESQDTSETKLLSMQVQNFRIYEGQRGFAFTSENSPDSPASMVMIYAPNGMGKTSICDALEWALTGKIQRLSDMEKLIGRNNMLLHNREKYKSVEEYRKNNEYASVKLVLKNRTGTQDELQRVVIRKPNDLNVGKLRMTPEGKEKTFHNELHWNQIIMPHDQIEKFVSAIKPADRYNEWMVCVDPNGILQEKYKSRYIEFSEAQKLCKDAETKLDKLVQEQENLKWVEAVSHELRKNITGYNESVPDALKLEMPAEKVGIDESLKIRTKAKKCNEILQNELRKAKKQQETLEFYLEREGECYIQLRKELGQRSDEYQQCDKNLNDRRLYEKLQKELETACKEREELRRESEILQYIKNQGRTQMERKTQQFFAVSEQLPKQERMLESIIKNQAKAALSLKELCKKIQQIQLEKSLRNTDEKELLELARKAEALEKQITAEQFALEQKKTVEKEALRRKKAQQKHRQELSEYILPEQLSEYSTHPIPQNHQLFNYAADIDELTHRYHANQTRQADYDEQVRKAKEVEQNLLSIAEQGRVFLEQHPEQCECPLCHTKFESWNLLYGATLKLESNQKDQLKESARRIQKETENIDAAYLRMRREWLAEREILIKKENEICVQYDQAFLAVEERKKSAENQIRALEQEEQNVHLNAAELGWNWERPLTVKEVEKVTLEQNKKRQKQESDAYAQRELLEQQKKDLQAERRNAECEVDKLKTWSVQIKEEPLWEKSVAYLKETSWDFDLDEREQSLYLKSVDQNNKIDSLQEKMMPIAGISHSNVEALDVERTRAQKALQKSQKVFGIIVSIVENSNPEIEDLEHARKHYILEQEQIKAQISELGNVICSEGVGESIRKYNEYKLRIESLEKKVTARKQAVQKAQDALEKEKETLLAELQKYFQQPLFNEIYQKIDPHPYMKKVSYEIMYNDEKNEPELYIKTQADEREPYHPELFFSTAQLNTVALSSFLSRALSLTGIPIGTIVIDDPVGHFDDMNILGFADLMRSIIEKSKKQIVITTHDETVYQIFRRKLPPEIYRSRFIDMTEE